MSHKNAWGLLLIVAMMVDCAESLGSVDLINLVGDPLYIHCRSKESDLGLIRLESDDDFAFKFHPHWAGSTSFACEFFWGEKSQKFDVWRGSKYADRVPCAVVGPCYYKITVAGFYWASENLPETSKVWTFYTDWVGYQIWTLEVVGRNHARTFRLWKHEFEQW